jgi:mannose-6-phosphate isomerase class I
MVHPSDKQIRRHVKKKWHCNRCKHYVNNSDNHVVVTHNSRNDEMTNSRNDETEDSKKM